MYPHERSLVKQLADKPFALIGVNSDDPATARAVVEKKNLTWRSFQNSAGDEEISTTWGIRGWPTIFIIDAEGKIRFKDHGGDFDSVIEECLAEIGHEVEIKQVHELEEDDDASDEPEEEEKEIGDINL